MVPRSARVGGDIRKKAGRDLDDDFKVIWIWGGNVRKFRRTYLVLAITVRGTEYHNRLCDADNGVDMYGRNARKCESRDEKTARNIKNTS
jgi:hypothetical protein